MVYWTTAAFTVGLLGHSLLELAARIFYANKNTVTPFWVALGATALNVVLCVLLAAPLGAAGLALANSIVVTLQSSTLLWLGWRARVRFDWGPVWRLCWRAGIALAVMAAIIWLVTQQTGWGHLRAALVGSVAGGGAYLALMALLNREETRTLLRTVHERVTGWTAQ